MATRNQCPRRDFLKASLAAGVTAFTQRTVIAKDRSPNDRIRVGVMGLNRGLSHVQEYCAAPNVEVAYVCDVDSRRVGTAVQQALESQKIAPQGVTDFRRILDDREVDAISIAAPNFWHAPATILACSAGKHVYVEKPGSHNPFESETMVQAALQHDRRVQLGTQRRSMPHYIEAVRRLQAGEIGTPKFARCWYDNARLSIGKGKRAPIPAWLNYELWQGPVVDTPYVDNLVHYNWHWRWHWGNGELGNNGIHALDVARWGLGVSTPKSISYSGGRYHFDDDQETPDTGYVSYQFDNVGIAWAQSSCHSRKPESHPFITFYGSDGSLSIDGKGFTIFDPNGEKVHHGEGDSNQRPHFSNFLDAIRNGTPLYAEIGNAQKSTMLCHLGNIAYRTGEVLKLNAAGEITNAIDLQPYWKREYRPGWTPTV